MKNKHLLAQLSIDEKISLCCGADFWRSHCIEKHGLPSIMVADGPHGVRFQGGQGDMLGIHASLPATCFPTSSLTACSWDRALIKEVAEAIAEEASSMGVDILLGPGLNIKRSPLCGRNFEYFSEDPCLTGKLGIAYVDGAQGKGVGCCLKHFAANSQEYKRFSSNSIVDERTLREIYLSAFEQVVKASQPAMVMSAYNKVNGTYASDNGQLLTGILRNEWGFDGVVVTDWGGMHDRVLGFQAGCDWSMPGGSKHLYRHAKQALKDGRLTEADIDRSADRMISCSLKAARMRRERTDFDEGAHHQLARRAAAASAVLLKSEGVLPLRGGSVSVTGHMAKHARFQGTGSSHINATRVDTLFDAAPDWLYTDGCDENGETTEVWIEAAKKAAAQTEVALVLVGLPERYESEGFDRDDMRMPDGHTRLIEAVSSVNKNTVVVLFCGSPVETEWIDDVKAVLYMGLPGQAGGQALVDILTGEVNPSGRLAETWPIYGADAPCAQRYGRPHRNAQYREGLYVGYRYYETAAVPVRFPFGFGLSYAQFEASDLTVDGSEIKVKIKNTGAVAGAQVVQIYVAPPREGLHRPKRELKEFAKLSLEPGETKEVAFAIDDSFFAVWADKWRIQRGNYLIQVGFSAHDIVLEKEIGVDGESIDAPSWQAGSWYEKPVGYPPKEALESALGHAIPVTLPPIKGNFTMENTVLEMAEHSRFMRFVKWAIIKVIILLNHGKADLHDPIFRMSFSSSADNALFALVTSACGALPERVTQGVLDIANGKIWRGIGRMIGIKRD